MRCNNFFSLTDLYDDSPPMRGFSKVPVVLAPRLYRFLLPGPLFESCAVIHVFRSHVCALDVLLPPSWSGGSAFDGRSFSRRGVAVCS